MRVSNAATTSAADTLELISPPRCLCSLVRSFVQVMRFES